MTRRQSPVVGMELDEFSDVALFRDRVAKFENAQRKYQGIPISRTAPGENLDEVIFEANTPDVEEVASLARNFRFFYADNEPTQFQKILTKVRRRTEDEWACGYMDWLSDQYKEAMKATQVSADLGHPVPNRRIIDLWFNSEFFHSEQAKRQELIDIHAAIGEVPSLFQLYLAIVRCSSFIRMLYSVVHALDADHKFVYSPNHHFGRGQSNGRRDA
ncbi:hypothetical protein SAMN06297164_0670 [Nitrosomonas ureae]|uniref:Uncharacterized protein n=2 Tax=Nitrosomonas ureae TaxID=44577 RepID=A0A286A483_9PROT|nr:hypothetical protein SAMN06297164_0670 [Nitrosomonas ureae]